VCVCGIEGFGELGFWALGVLGFQSLVWFLLEWLSTSSMENGMKMIKKIKNKEDILFILLKKYLENQNQIFIGV
jgi:hypothetical protein